jgi:type II secretory pathway pseudopilin PulG
VTERTVLVRLRATATDFNRAMAGARASVQGLTKDIDTSSDRTAWMAQSILALGPTLAPVGAAIVPIFAGLATQMGVAAVAGGTLALAFNGIGDAVKAVNEYQLEPTAKNLEKMQLAMEKLGSDGAHFVKFLDQVGDELEVLQMDARGGGMFAGMETGITALMERMPELRSIITNVSAAIGELSAQTGQGLSGEGFDAFFSYLETDAKPILLDMGAILGNFTEGLANLLVAFGPLTRSYSAGFAEMARSFADWSSGLDNNQGFQSFLAYAEESLPRVGQLFGSLVDAFVSLVHAAAPVGEILLPALSGVLEVMSVLLDSPLGSVFIALGAAAGTYGRAATIARITTGGLGASFLSATVNAKGFQAALQTGNMRAFGKAALGAGANMAIIGASMTGLPEKFGLTNTALGAMIGMIGGPWGAAAGAAVGLTLDLVKANDESAASLEDLSSTFDRNTGAITENTRARVTADAQANGLLDAAAQLGINLDTVTEAIMGNKAAQDSLNASMAAYAAARAGVTAQAEGSPLTDDEEAALRTDAAYDALANGVNFLGAAFGAEQGKAQQFAAGMGGVEDAADGAAGAVQNFRSAVEKANRALDTRSNLRSYEQSLDDFTKAVNENLEAWKKNGANMDRSLPRWRVLEDALDGIATEANKTAEGLDKADRPAFLKAAQADFIRSARLLGFTKGEAEKLARELIVVDQSNAKPEVDMNKSAFDAKAAAVAARMAALDGDVANTYINTYVTTVRRNRNEAMMERATGGYVRGPGSTTSDSIPAWLSDKEYVIKASAVAKYGVAMFDELNAQRFAGGGLVGPWGGWGSPPPDNPNGPGSDLTGPLRQVGAVLATIVGGFKEYENELNKIQRAVSKNNGEWTKETRKQARELFKEILLAQKEQIKEAIGKLDVSVDTTVREFARQFERLQRRIEDAGGRWTTALTRDAEKIQRLAGRYERLTTQLAAQQETLAKVQAAYDAVTAQRADLESAVAGVFSGAVTGGGLTGLDKTLHGDIANRKTMDGLLAKLRDMGLDVTGDRGGLYNELVRSGDIKTAQQLVNAGPGSVDYYEGLYQERGALNAASASAQGELAFGRMQAELHGDLVDAQAAIDRTTEKMEQTRGELRQELRDMREELKTIVPNRIGNEVGGKINSAATSGAQSGGRNPNYTNYWR